MGAVMGVQYQDTSDWVVLLADEELSSNFKPTSVAGEYVCKGKIHHAFHISKLPLHYMPEYDHKTMWSLRIPKGFDARYSYISNIQPAIIHNPRKPQVPLEYAESCLESYGAAVLQLISSPTVGICKNALKRDMKSIQYVPEEIKSKLGIWENTVVRNGYLLKYVPEERRTWEMCMLAVADRVEAIDFVVREWDRRVFHLLCSHKFVSMATLWIEDGEYPYIRFLARGTSLTAIPEEHITENILLFVASKKVDIGKYKDHVPQKLLTAKLCKTLVTMNATALQIVPAELRTKELIFIATHRFSNMHLLKDINSVLEFEKDEQLGVLSEISKDDESFPFYMQTHFRTWQFDLPAIMAALQNKHCDMSLLRNNIELTPEIAEFLCAIDGNNLKFVPDEMRTEQMNMFAASEPATVITYKRFSNGKRFTPFHHEIKREHKTKAVCAVAVAKDSSNIPFVPKERMTVEIDNMCRAHQWYDSNHNKY